jgi:hypothetical protein
LLQWFADSKKKRGRAVTFREVSHTSIKAEKFHNPAKNGPHATHHRHAPVHRGANDLLAAARCPGCQMPLDYH